MRASIAVKVSLTLICASVLIVVSMYYVMQWTFQRGFVQFVEARENERLDRLVELLADEYANAGGWDELRADPMIWRRLARAPIGPGPNAAAGARFGGVPNGAAAPPRFGFGVRPPPQGPTFGDFPPPLPGWSRGRPNGGFMPWLAVLDADKKIVVGDARDVSRLSLHPIEYAGAVVGFLGSAPRPELDDVTDLRFVEQQRDSFVIVAGAVLAISMLLGVPLARALVAPLRRITGAMRELAAGRHTTRLPVTSRDELGRLAADFNDLARTLESAETMRRRWVADVSHELRTPLSVLRGEIEAMQDGVRPMTPRAIDMLGSEVAGLSRLVDDLYQLSLLDVGELQFQMTSLDPLAVLTADLHAMRGAFAERALTLDVQLDACGPVRMNADAGRLSQLFRNILRNSVAHTAINGRVVVRATRDVDRLTIVVEDSTPGVDDAALTQLFERFFRADPSRTRATGGAGLGLAICRGIVEAHGGSIVASHSSLGGLAIQIGLPVAAS